MAEFNELIKKFERIRDYMREFFIYGFKVRGEYTEKSARTYDNEKRRVESFLGNYMNYQQTSKGKAVSIAVDSGSVFQNPLYAAWKAKSFTDNDIMLHFYILELLNSGQSMTAEALSSQISIEYGADLDSQIVRLKLKEYEKQGIILGKKEGKQIFYSLASEEELELDPLYNSLLEAVMFFQEAAPFGFVGSTLLDRERKKNERFSFKHHFLVHTLEDGVLTDILRAMEERRRISFVNKSYRRGSASLMEGVPLKILVSTQTGRRYLCIYREKTGRFHNIRLDYMSEIKILEIIGEYDTRKEQLEKNLPKSWGVTFGGKQREEEIQIKLFIDEKWEKFILERLEREGRGGKVVRLKENVYQYTGSFFDTNEMLPWVKTFTGRIMEIEGTNSYAINKLRYDLNKMYEMYGEG